jgi:acyl-coenzyme A thioesterase PaaI-like protein
MIRDALLTRTLPPLADGSALALDRGFQGLPDMAHGGTVLALFDAATGITAARHVRGHYMKRVPLGSPLTLARASTDGRERLALVDPAGVALVDGFVSASASVVASSGGADAPAREPLPISTSCFVCGRDNDVGLRASLAADDRVVSAIWSPRSAFRVADGTLAPIVLTSLLDEAAFWLGALATGESGMTTELAVTLHGSVAFGAPVTIVGDRGSVTARRDDPRYIDTTVTAYADGAIAATARITFVLVRGAARRLAAWLAATNAQETIRRVFPAYVARS